MLGVWRNSLTAISYCSRTKLHIWLENGFNLALFRISTRNKARTKPSGLSICRFATEHHRLSCQIYLISSSHKACRRRCYLPLEQVSIKQIIWVSISIIKKHDVLCFVFYSPGKDWQYFYVNLSPTEILIMNRFIIKEKNKKPYAILSTTFF